MDRNLYIVQGWASICLLLLSSYAGRSDTFPLAVLCLSLPFTLSQTESLQKTQSRERPASLLHPCLEVNSPRSPLWSMSKDWGAQGPTRFNHSD